MKARISQKASSESGVQGWGGVAARDGVEREGIYAHKMPKIKQYILIAFRQPRRPR
jgi:hypothetical protein